MKNPFIIAHRGASGLLPEHTLAAVSLAYFSGAKFMEPDVVLTKDKQPIVLHDTDLKATTNVQEIFPNRSSYSSRNFTLEEIRRLSAGERRNPETGEKIFPNRFQPTGHHFKVPTLREYIQLVQELNRQTGKTIGIYPEVKENDLEAARIIHDLLIEYEYDQKLDQIYVQSFHFEVLQYLKEEIKTPLPLIYLLDEGKTIFLHEYEIELYSYFVDGIGFSYRDLLKGDNNFVQTTKAYGLETHVYTLRKDQLPESFDHFNKLLGFLYYEMKVDAVFTDFPHDVSDFLNNK